MKKRAGFFILFLLLGFNDFASTNAKFSANVIPYRKGNLWGFCDSMKTMIVPPIYREVEILSVNLLLGIDNGSYDFYNGQGKKLMTTEGMHDFVNGYAVIFQNNLSGLIDSNGRIIVPAKYHAGIQKVTEGLIVCRREYEDKGCVVYDTAGRVLFGIDSGNVSEFYHGRAWVTTNTALGSVDRNGDVKWLKREPEYYYEKSIHGFMQFNTADARCRGLMNYNGEVVVPADGYRVIDFESDNLIKVQKGGNRYGYIDTTGKIIIPVIYDQIQGAIQNENLSDLHRGERKWQKIFLVKKNDLYGLIDSTGFVIVPAECNGINSINEDVFSFVKNGKYGFCDIHGKQIVPPIYDQAGNFNDGISWVKENGKIRLINKSGKYINNELYDEIREHEWIYKDSIIGVVKNGKHGYVNYYGKAVVPLQYDDGVVIGEKVIMVRKDSLRGLLDLKGNVIVPIAYSWINYPNEGYCWACRKGQNVILDSIGHEIIPANKCEINEYSSCFLYGYSFVTIDGKQTWVNTRGQVFSPWFKYDNISLRKGWFVVFFDGKMGVLNEHEQLLFSGEYDSIDHRVSPTLFIVSKNHQPGYVNANGTEYFED